MTNEAEIEVLLGLRAGDLYHEVVGAWLAKQALRGGVGRSAPREEDPPSTGSLLSLPTSVKVLVSRVPVGYQPPQDEAEAASPLLVLPT